MNQNKTAISVIMPVYNSEKYLSACVESILMQDFDDYELLLIDDGSTDGSPSICDAFAEKDSRVRVFHKENGGICEARNFGMERARGRYIAFSDHDDIVLPGFLSENYRALEESQADIVKFGRKGMLIRAEKVLTADTRRFEDRMLSHTDVVNAFFELRLKETMNCVWDGFFCREFLIKNNIWFDTRYRKGGEDIDFCSRCFIHAEQVLLRSSVYYEHFIRIGVSTSTIEDSERMLKYEYLTDNLIECARLAGIDSGKHAAGYVTCIVKEQVYPSVKYMLQTGSRDSEICTCLSKIAEDRDIPGLLLSETRRVSRKWGLFTWLFSKKQYAVLIFLVRMNLQKKKFRGDTT